MKGLSLFHAYHLSLPNHSATGLPILQWVAIANFKPGNPHFILSYLCSFTLVLPIHSARSELKIKKQKKNLDL